MPGPILTKTQIDPKLLEKIEEMIAKLGIVKPGTDIKAFARVFAERLLQAFPHITAKQLDFPKFSKLIQLSLTKEAQNKGVLTEKFEDKLDRLSKNTLSPEQLNDAILRALDQDKKVTLNNSEKNNLRDKMTPLKTEPAPNDPNMLDALTLALISLYGLDPRSGGKNVTAVPFILGNPTGVVDENPQNSTDPIDVLTKNDPLDEALKETDLMDLLDNTIDGINSKSTPKLHKH